MKNISIHTEAKIEEEDVLDVFYNIEIYNKKLYEIMSTNEKYEYNNDKLIIDWNFSLEDDIYKKYEQNLNALVNNENIMYNYTMYSDAHTTMQIM